MRAPRRGSRLPRRTEAAALGCSGASETGAGEGDGRAQGHSGRRAGRPGALACAGRSGDAPARFLFPANAVSFVCSCRRLAREPASLSGPRGGASWADGAGGGGGWPGERPPGAELSRSSASGRGGWRWSTEACGRPRPSGSCTGLGRPQPTA